MSVHLLKYTHEGRTVCVDCNPALRGRHCGECRENHTAAMHANDSKYWGIVSFWRHTLHWLFSTQQCPPIPDDVQ